jgi:hypothetical protein
MKDITSEDALQGKSDKTSQKLFWSRERVIRAVKNLWPHEETPLKSAKL